MYKVCDIGLLCFDENLAGKCDALGSVNNRFSHTAPTTFVKFKTANAFFLWSRYGFIGTLSLILKCFYLHLLTTYTCIDVYNFSFDGPV